AARHRELELRAALGARRSRLFRQLLTESFLLTTSGAALGITIGAIGLRTLVGMRPASLAALQVAHLDGSTVLVAAGITALSGLLFGVMGAMQSAGNMTRRTVRSGPATSPGRRSERVRGALVVTEMALSALLIVGASMLVRSVSKMQNADLGYQPRGLYSVQVDLPPARYATPASRMEFVAELTRQLAQLGTLRAITVANDAPHSMSFQVGRLEVEGQAAPPASATSFVATNAVQANYFATMGIRLTQGTSFTDTTAAAHQVIINEGFARRIWGTSSALGHRLRVTDSGETPWSTVVGVVADARTLGPMLENAAPMLYAPMNGALGTSAPAVLVRTSGTANPIARVRSLVHVIDPRLAVTVRSELDLAATAIATPRYVMLMLSVFTVLALVLAAIGLYGVMSYAVAQRTHDIGIRIALGAPRSTVARTVIRRGVTLAVVGAALGLVAAHWGTRLIQHQLFGVAQSDPLSLAAAVIVLLGAAVLACVVPTRRALKVDPITAIRTE
ncbi:MAG: FtsX-like permease family protein, partial [Gemmatimonadaceae bacterium]